MPASRISCSVTARPSSISRPMAPTTSMVSGAGSASGCSTRRSGVVVVAAGGSISVDICGPFLLWPSRSPKSPPACNRLPGARAAYYPRREGRWANALPAAAFSARVARGSVKVFAAADAARADVCLLFPDCARALPAADFSAPVARGLFRVLAADDAALGLVFLPVMPTSSRSTCTDNVVKRVLPRSSFEDRGSALLFMNLPKQLHNVCPS